MHTRPCRATLCAAFLLAFSFVFSRGLILAAAAESQETEQLSYEVKFLLDSNKVLGDKHLLTQSFRELVGIEDAEEYKTLEVLYLETEDRYFQKQGWINRIRWRAKKNHDLLERTYKRRYTVQNEDLEQAFERAQADGFVTGSGYEVQVDWGYGDMTLSFSKTIEEKITPDSGGLSHMSTGEAESYVAKTIPEEEGVELITKAQKVGVIQFYRIKGKWQDIEEETEVTVEIWPICEQGETAYITELSFKAEEGDVHTIAREKRKRMAELLDEKEILLHKDSLKTSRILDAYLRKRPETVSFTLPTSLKTIGEDAFAGTAAASVWIPKGTEEITGDPFASGDESEDSELKTLLVIGTPGSGADDFATEYGYSFIPE